jgi:hypothetical protein
MFIKIPTQSNARGRAMWTKHPISEVFVTRLALMYWAGSDAGDMDVAKVNWKFLSSEQATN